MNVPLLRLQDPKRFEKTAIWQYNAFDCLYLSNCFRPWNILDWNKNSLVIACFQFASSDIGAKFCSPSCPLLRDDTEIRVKTGDSPRRPPTHAHTPTSTPRPLQNTTKIHRDSQEKAYEKNIQIEKLGHRVVLIAFTLHLRPLANCGWVIWKHFINRFHILCGQMNCFLYWKFVFGVNGSFVNIAIAKIINGQERQVRTRFKVSSNISHTKEGRLALGLSGFAFI